MRAPARGSFGVSTSPAVISEAKVDLGERPVEGIPLEVPPPEGISEVSDRFLDVFCSFLGLGQFLPEVEFVFEPTLAGKLEQA